jgi:hypothetical protein
MVGPSLFAVFSVVSRPMLQLLQSVIDFAPIFDVDLRRAEILDTKCGKSLRRALATIIVNWLSGR